MKRKFIFLLSPVFLLIFVALGSQAQANLLTNGNFNTGDFTGWWTWVDEPANTSAEVQSTYNYDGTYNAKLSSWNTAWPTNGPVAVGQTFDFTGGADYSLSFVYSTQWTDWGTADYLIKYYDAGWTELVDYEWDTLFYQEAGPTDWVSVYLEFTTPATTAHVDVQFRAYDWADAVYFDDVVVIPEPATLILLGVGSLVVLRRRKKA